MSGKRLRPDEEHTPAKEHKTDESRIPADSSLPRPSQRQQERSLDESHISAPSIFSAVSDTQTEITVPGPSTPATKMTTFPMVDPAAFAAYYNGLPLTLGNLLARSNPEPWAMPLVKGRAGTKTAFVVTHHPLR
jgi:hypothetical protein